MGLPAGLSSCLQDSVVAAEERSGLYQS